MWTRIAIVHALFVATSVAILGALLGLTSPARVFALAAAAGALTTLPLLLYRRTFLAPLHQVTSRLRELEAGAFAGRVYVETGGELRSHTQAVNELSDALAARFARLESDRGRLVGILGGMVEGVVALDDEERIVFANQRAGLLLEFPADRAVGRKFWEVVRQRAVVDLVTAAGASRESRRAEVEWQGGAARSLALYAAPLASEADGLIVVLQDVSDIKRLERLRQEFVANVSHELKTPLAVIKASTETLIDGAADDPVHRRAFLDQIDEQANRLHALILDLLALARIEGAEAAPEPTAVPLHQCAAEAVERHRNRASAKGVELKVADAAPVTAWTDEEAVEIILDNLIDNAIKYTPEGGSVVVSSGSGGESTWLEVSDTGLGIPESDLPRVFERFYRVDKARSRELGGTGLGLSIVKHLAHANGGSVTARSSPGRGSAFVVRLPTVPAGMNPAVRDASPPR